MISAMVEGTKEEISKWEKLVAEGGGSAEIDLEPDIHHLSGRVLSLTVFGGEQYKTGVKIYEIQSDVSALYFKMLRKIGYWLIPRYRYRSNRCLIESKSYPDVKNSSPDSEVNQQEGRV